MNVRLSGIDHSVLDSYVELLRRTAIGVFENRRNSLARHCLCARC